MPKPTTIFYVTAPMALTLILGHIVSVPTIIVPNFRITDATFSGVAIVTAKDCRDILLTCTDHL